MVSDVGVAGAGGVTGVTGEVEVVVKRREGGQTTKVRTGGEP